MHVLVLSTLYPNPARPRFGTFVARSLEALAKHTDWDVTVVNPIGMPPVAFGKYRELSDLEPLAVENGVTVHRPRFTLIPKFGARRNAGAIAKAVLPVIEGIHAKQPVHVIDAEFFFPDGPAAAIISETTGIPFSIKARGSDIAQWKKLEYAREQIIDAALKAHGLLAVSAALADEMAELGMPREDITVHYTGLDRDRFRPLGHTQLRAQLGRQLGFDLPDNVPMLACVGNLTENKGQDIAIKALEQLNAARLVLVGKGEFEDQLRALVDELGLSDRVHFAGSVDHDVMPVILSAADVMVLPTVAEGLANAWVESLACGTPVVTTDVGGVREVITSELGGRLVERTPHAVAEGIRAILNAPPRSEDVAASIDRFSWEHNARTLAEHLKRVALRR